MREFVYEYAAVSPQDGTLDFMTAEKMNTENMSRFLDQVRNAHPDDFLIMILDGASSHKAKGLNIPKKMRLMHLPLLSGAEPSRTALEHSPPRLFRESCL